MDAIGTADNGYFGCLAEWGGIATEAAVLHKRDGERPTKAFDC